MLTNGKVLEVFKDYLSQDPDYEVVMTSHVSRLWAGTMLVMGK
ncbi:MAG: hypothetical protein AAGU32_13705 [Bacillota bacterium]